MYRCIMPVVLVNKSHQDFNRALGVVISTHVVGTDAHGDLSLVDLGNNRDHDIHGCSSIDLEEEAHDRGDLLIVSTVVAATPL